MEMRNQIFFACINPLESLDDIFLYLNLILLLIQKNLATLTKKIHRICLTFLFPILDIS